MWKKSFAVICFILWIKEAPVDGATMANDWGYSGSVAPQYWKNVYSGCGATHQSPVNIVKKDTMYDKYLKPFHFTSTNRSSYVITNKGMNVVITFGTTAWKAAFVGYSDFCYRILQMHFHWGQTFAQGSEHTIDGQSFPFETHFVMWNCRDFTNPNEAAKGVNGLAVVGIFSELDDAATPNPIIENITQALRDPRMRQCPCRRKDDYVETTIPYFDVNGLFPKIRNRFYRYKGSLTTPPCTENVLWSVFDEKMKITSRQLNVLRNLQFNKDQSGQTLPMVNNYRPAMPLNPEDPANAYRFISASFKANSASTSQANLLIMVQSFILIIFLNFLCSY